MNDTTVPKRIPNEEIRKKALLAVMERFKPFLERESKFSMKYCEASCYADHWKDEHALNACLRECKAYWTMATIAEKLGEELFTTAIEIIWGGGNIDPKPFEREVRKRFSHPRGER